ncbi:MAG: amino acid adenylation domain-containing protein, partial [Lutisporaceae bacterium]
VLNLPTDYQRPALQSFEGDTIEFEIDKTLTNKLRQIAKATGSTMYMVLLSSFNVLLSKYSGQEDIIVGSPIAGRPHADLGNIIGMFVNTLVMRNYPSGEKTFKEFLREVKENALGAYENQDYQFEELVEKLNVARDFSRNPMFDVMFVLQNMDMGEAIIEGMKLSLYKSENRISKLDMTVTVVELENSTSIDIQYCTKLFNKATIERMYKHLDNIIQSITENIDIKLSEVEMLTEEERQQILIDFNNTKADYPKDKTIHQLFEEQVARTPDNIAVVYEDKQLTYRELNEKANQLARILREKGVSSNSIVGIMVERSLEMLIGILGILKAGGAYLPIDLEYPEDRVRYILEDSGAEIILTQSHLQSRIILSQEILILDNEQIFTGDKGNFHKISKPDDLAYIIYTSGTTGKPKGVMLQNNSLVNYINWFAEEVKITYTDKAILLSSYAFDLGYTALYPSILNGAELHIVAKEIYSEPEALIKYINDNRITYLKLTPSLYNTVCNSEYFSEGKGLKSLRLIVLGGEQINVVDVEKTYKLYGNIKIMNHYGPTETTVGTAANIIETDWLDEFKALPVIGKPISNSKIYIIDRYSKLNPLGVAGELCISGVGLARGYLNRPELTAEKFVDNPFEPGTRMYRTGDLVRWLPDGNIEFLGRIDHQVKIRGYRIELGEIENKLLSYETVKETVIIARDDNSGSKYLCAYVVGAKELTISELREHLSKDLPNYMIPSYFIQLDKMPLTPNGKVDRKALPEPNGSISSGSEYEAPRNSTEEKLVTIWREVLGIEKIGINDNFFELGGHSLKATSLVAKIHKVLNTEIPLKEIFKAPTIKEISEYIRASEESIYSSIETVEEKDYYEMSSAQKRIYVLQQFELNSTSYNMPRALELEGELDIEWLK